MNRDREQAEELDEIWRRLHSGEAASLRSGDNNLASFSQSLYRHIRPAAPAKAFIATLKGGLEPELAFVVSRRKPGFQPAVLISGVAVLAALAVLVLVAVTSSRGRVRAVSAAELIQRVEKSATTSQLVGVNSLVLTATGKSYSPASGELVGEGEWKVWYKGTDQQRTEIDFVARGPSGAELFNSSSIELWDGKNAFIYEKATNEVEIRSQDPNRPAGGWYSSLFRGADLGSLQSCHSDMKLAGEDRIAGRAATVVDLGRSYCGFKGGIPGYDGRRIMWIDEKTSLVLKSEIYSQSGVLTSVIEVTEVKYDLAIDGARFVFDLPTAIVKDMRPELALYPSSINPIRLDTITEAQTGASFQISTPGFLPDGYKLETVEQLLANPNRVHYDQVALRYSDSTGNWLIIQEGYGPYYAGWRNLAPPAYVTQIDLEGIKAYVVDGSPGYVWQPGTMLSLTWEFDSLGTISLGSNSLTEEQLIAIAKSMR